MRKYKRIPRRFAAPPRDYLHLPSSRGRFILKGRGSRTILSGRPGLSCKGGGGLRPEYRCGPSRATLPRRFTSGEGTVELDKSSTFDLNLWLPGDILSGGQDVAFAHSIELRVPLPRPRGYRAGGTLPSSYKINGVNTKYIFRRAETMLPNEWAAEEGLPRPIRKCSRRINIILTKKYYLRHRRRSTSSGTRCEVARRHGRAREQRTQDMDSADLPYLAESSSARDAGVPSDESCRNSPETRTDT